MIISNVKKIMETRKITIRALMEQTSLADKTILRARSRHINECRLYTLEAIARALGCTTKDLYDEVPDWVDDNYPHTS